MEKIYSFNGGKETSIITSVSETTLPEYHDMRRILLRSKQEVELALSKGIKVFQQQVTSNHGGHVIVYIEVPFNKLLEVADTY